MLFDSTDFLPLRECGHWSRLHAGVHMAADVAMFGACMGLALLLFSKRARSAPVLAQGRGVGALALMFVVLCGTSHLMAAVVFFHPAYRVLGLLKLSAATFACLALVVLAMHLRRRSGPTRTAQNDPAQKANELQQQAAELERINAELDGFAAAAAHDLKAPLRAIQNAATWLEEDLPGSAWTPESRESMLLLKSRAARMDTLLDALLQYARAGRTELVSEEVPTRQVVDDIVLLLGEPARSAVHAAPDLPVLVTPRVPFERVLLNLISNAVKHARGKPGLVVSVNARAEGDGYIFDVTDDGPGIPPEYFESIFEVFTTLRPRDEVEGAGMGLALVKKLVESHGGRVTVSSALGQGTTFSFYWPKTFP